MSVVVSADTSKPDLAMSVVASAVNFILSHGLSNHHFQSLLSETDAEYSDVFYCIDVRWLSRGMVLKRYLALRSEIKIFEN
jgi:hypothetical protein